jgi:hypothetical protein
LSQFYPTKLNRKDTFDVIMVGGWSYRKGCDLIGISMNINLIIDSFRDLKELVLNYKRKLIK